MKSNLHTYKLYIPVVNYEYTMSNFFCFSSTSVNNHTFVILFFSQVYLNYLSSDA